MKFPIALAALVFMTSIAHGDGLFTLDGTHVPDPDADIHDQAGIGCWSCETRSLGKKIEVIMAETKTQGSEVAVRYCVDGGGVKEECISNLKCVFGDDSHHPPHERTPFYDFGKGRSGYGYCYDFDADGKVLNGGQPVNDVNCNLAKTYYDFVSEEHHVCVEWTPYHHIMNEGRTFDPVFCYKGNPN